MKHAHRWGAVALSLALAACTGGSLKPAGETCTASSECDVGLLCDTGVTPHVCAATGTGMPGGPADAGVDAPSGAGDASPADAPPIDAPVDAPVDAMVDAAI